MSKRSLQWEQLQEQLLSVLGNALHRRPGLLDFPDAVGRGGEIDQQHGVLGGGRRGLHELVSLAEQPLLEPPTALESATFGVVWSEFPSLAGVGLGRFRIGGFQETGQ